MNASQPADSEYLLIRPQSAQSCFNVAALARELAALQTGAETRRVLFDWSQIGSWPFAAPSAAAIREWKATAPPIARAAFIHRPKWNRHAAVLSALLRISNSEVRCFRHTDTEKAIAWLEQASQVDDSG